MKTRNNERYSIKGVSQTMKVFLNDAQTAIVIATLHNHQLLLSCLLMSSQLNNTERIDPLYASDC